MTKPPFQIDAALLAKVAGKDTATDKASDKAWLLVGLLEHMLEHHGAQELVRRGCPPPLIGALSE